MDLFGTVIFVIVATGGVLVVGGIYLIASGAVKLAGDPNGGTSLKLGKLLQVGTTVPGLGIFVIGLAFDGVGLYYVNQSRVDTLNGQIDNLTERLNNAHVIRMGGMVETAAAQDASLTVCLSPAAKIPGNAPFQMTMGPYLDIITAKIESPGAEAQQFMIYPAYGLARPPKSLQNVGDVRQSDQNGAVDIGRVRLNQQVDLSHPGPLHAAAPLPVVPAGSAYGIVQ